MLHTKLNKMKKQLKKKRFSFIITIILSLSILATNSCKKGTITETGHMTTPAGSTIIYTDINPDTLISSTYAIYNLDLNKDGITDFTINRDTHTSVCDPVFIYYLTIINLSAKPANANNAIISDGASHAYALDSSAAIIPASLWATAPQVLLIGARGDYRCVASFHGSYNWLNAADKYLGLKFIKGNNTYYGWARLQATFYNTSNPRLRDVKLTIKEYAYNSSPNQPILAGQKK